MLAGMGKAWVKVAMKDRVSEAFLNLSFDQTRPGFRG
jgi:hypothetical protein